LVQEEKTVVDRYLDAGGRVIVLANHFYHDTVMLANHLTEPHGVCLEDRECGELLGDLECEHRHITAHPATEGVGRLHWYRPSPMVVKKPARVLVHNPEQPGEGFVACAGLRQNLFVVGCSLLHSLVSPGWPYDNGRLLANLLAKDVGRPPSAPGWPR
jgi:hypothetical protein